MTTENQNPIIETEQAVLGACCKDNTVIDQVADLLSVSDYITKDHREIFAKILSLSNEGKPVDEFTLGESLEGTVVFQYIAKLAKAISAANVMHYAQLIKEASIERQLKTAANKIYKLSDSHEIKLSEKLDIAEKHIFQITEANTSNKRDFHNITELLHSAIDNIDSRYQSKDAISGLGTGFVDFDDKTQGLQNGDLVIVAGRPSMGKTAFAMNIGENVAIKQKLPVAVFSLEMPAEQLTNRMISSQGNVYLKSLRSGRLHDSDWPKITAVTSLINTAPIFIDDTPAPSVREIRAKARRLKREHGLALVIVDYLQLMRGEGENQNLRVADISQGLKSLARELSIPVVALSQLSRDIDKRNDKKPMLSDLRDSGAIEQDADLIVFLYREEFYKPNTTKKGLAEVIIGKQRNGEICSMYLSFLGQYTRFENHIGLIYEDLSRIPDAEHWDRGFEYV